MSVKAVHPQYKCHLDKWERCSDAFDGQDAVHAKRTKYLPKLIDQEEESYRSYLTRATFYNATLRTSLALMGLLTRKAPSIAVPKVTEESFTNVSMDGQPLSALILTVLRGIFREGRIGLLVDFPTTSPAGITVAEAQYSNSRPYIRSYCAKSIRNWKTDVINNVEILSLVVLGETFNYYINEFEYEERDRYRVLSLIDGVYTQRVYEVTGDGKDVLIEGPITPLKNGAPMNTIPFFIINSNDVSASVSDPPLLDLVNLNMAHYRVTADYEHGCHFTGLPTPVISGHHVQSEGEKLYIGSTAAWVFPDSSAKAYFLEFTGQGLEALERNLQAKQDQMAVIGARLLANEKKAVETATTASIRQSGENSGLSTIREVVSGGLTLALQTYSEWLTGSDEKVSIELNKDFTGIPLTAPEITALVSAWQSGAISHETLFENFKSGELYDDDDVFEDEQEKIDANPPSNPNTTSGPNSDGSDSSTAG